MIAPAASTVPGHDEPTTFSRIWASPASWPSNSSVGLGRHPDQRRQHVQHRHRYQRDHDRQRQVAPRVLRFLARGGDAVQTDEGEEDDARGGRDAGEAERGEVGQVVGVPSLDADDDEHDEHGDLDDHHDGVGLRRLADPADQQQGAHDDQDHRGQVEHAALFRRVRQRLGHLDTEDVVEELVDVFRPARRRRPRPPRPTRAAGRRRLPAPSARRASRRCRSTTSRQPVRPRPIPRSTPRSGRRRLRRSRTTR